MKCFSFKPILCCSLKFIIHRVWPSIPGGGGAGACVLTQCVPIISGKGQ